MTSMRTPGYPTALTRVGQALAVLLIVAGVVLTVGPRSVRPFTGIPHDLEHFAFFALVGLAVGLSFPRRLLVMAVASVGIIGGLELGQLLVSHRHAYLHDFLTNLWGVYVGMLASVVVHSLVRKFRPDRQSSPTLRPGESA
jgi:VanZ family protein